MQPASLLIDYQQTLDYLYTRLPMFSRIGAAAMKPSLDNTLALCAGLDNPERKFKSIHIAGTNGKGSTSHMLAAILQEAGYKTGLYTSPHLIDFRERIRINGVPVSEDFVVRFVAEHKELIESISPSFFEITVAMAFEAFAEAGVDIAVIETGLGGRLDSTNVITPELSIITNISLDHTDLLGSTIAEIAREKAGIIKPRVPVVIGQFDEDAFEVFRKVSAELNAPMHTAWQGAIEIIGSNFPPGTMRYRPPGDETGVLLQTDLRGSFQEHNIRTVFTAISLLADNGWKISMETAAGALAHVKERTGLRGRWDVLQKQPLIIADVAHNPDGIAAGMTEWAHIEATRKHIILGFVRDKDVRSALEKFPKEDTYHFCAANSPRALPADDLARIASEIGLRGTAYPSVSAAVDGALHLLAQDDALLITGSFYIVGEALQALDNRQGVGARP